VALINGEMWSHVIALRKYILCSVFYCAVGNLKTLNNISLVCDKSVTTQNLSFLSYWYTRKKKRLQMLFLTGIVSKRSLQNLPLESSCVVVALIENYSTSKPLKVSPEKSQILS
jgi:hypothetical protein